MSVTCHLVAVITLEEECFSTNVVDHDPSDLVAIL